MQLFKPGNINEKRQEGEESCRQTDNGNDSYEVADEGQVLLVEKHGRARGRTVLPAHECVTQVWVDLELSGAPETIVSLDSHGGLVSRVRVCQQVLWTRIGLVTIREPRKRITRSDHVV